MGVLADLGRAATGAWSPTDSILAAGTAAEATDFELDGSPRLELFKLDQATGKVDRISCSPTSERFNRLAWSPAGLLAGGLNDGTVRIWDAPDLLRDRKVVEECGAEAEAAHVVYGGPTTRKRHTAPVRGLDFNPVTHTLLASGAADSELLIWDLASGEGPKVHAPGSSADRSAQQASGAKAAEITALAWNRKVKTILSSTNSNALTVVWDLRQKKKVASIADPRGRVRSSALAWHPTIATQVVVAVEDAVSEAMLLWDLRKASTPLQKYGHHQGGVIALAWNEHDEDMILTTGKDSRTCIISARSGEVLSEMPKTSNWNFDVCWSPKVPGIYSTSSLDGRLGVHSLLSPSTPGAPSFSTASALADSFNIDETEFTATSPQLSSGNVQDMTRPPKWLKRPVGCVFGFGGSLVKFGKSSADKVEVHSIVTETDFLEDLHALEKTLESISAVDLSAYCKRLTEDGADSFAWCVLQTQFEDDARRKLVRMLGLAPPVQSSSQTDPTIGLKSALPLAKRFVLQPEPTQEQETQTAEGNEAESAMETITNEELSGPAPWETDDADDLGDTVQNGWSADDSNSLTSKADKSGPLEKPQPEISVDETIKRSILVGDFEAGVKAALQAGRNSDALMLAHCGGPNLWIQTQEQLLSNHSVESMRSLFRVIVSPKDASASSLTGNSSFADKESWKEALSVIAAYDTGDDFVNNCNNLGDVLLQQDSSAALCFYMAALNVNMACRVWMREQPDPSDSSRPYRQARVNKLVPLVTKARVLLAASLMAEGEREVSTIAVSDESPSLIFLEVASLLASEGELELALKYVNSLPPHVGGLCGTAGDLAERVKNCLMSVPKGTPAKASIGHYSQGMHPYQSAALPPSQSQMSNFQSPAPVSLGGQFPGHSPAQGPPYVHNSASIAPPVYQNFNTQTQARTSVMSGPSPPPTRQDLQARVAAPPPVQSSYTSTTPMHGFAQPVVAPPVVAPPPSQAGEYATSQPTAPSQGPQGPAPVVPDFGDTQFYTPSTVANAAAPPVFSTNPPAVPPPLVGQTQTPPRTFNAPPPPETAPPQINIEPTQPVMSAMPGAISTARTATPSVGPPPTVPPRSATVGPPPVSGAKGLAGAGQNRKVPDSAEVAGIVKMNSTQPAREPVVTLAEADVSQVPPSRQPIVTALRGGFSQVSAMNQSPVFKRKMDDVNKKLGRLVYRLNAGSLEEGVIAKLSEMASGMSSGNWDAVSSVVVKLLKENWEGNNEWILGLKRLAESGKTGR